MNHLSARGQDLLRRLAPGTALSSGATLASVACAALSLLAVAVVFASDAPASWLVAAMIAQVAAIVLAVAGWHGSQRRHAEMNLMIESDPATGCLNRRGFARALEETLENAIAVRGEVALLAVDLDHFKQINDRYGHNVGDVVLSEVATTLAETVGSDGMVARVGGEEFLVLLPNADAELAGVMAELMMSRLRTQRIASMTPGTTVTMSVGIAVEHATRRAGAALRARADEALYIAKRTGRDRVLLWAPGVRSHATPAAAQAAISERVSTPRPRISGARSAFADM